MSQCPFANFPNLIDPETYVNGMPYETLAEIRRSGPVHYMDGSYQDVPYWLITGRDQIDFISKNPKLFSSEARSAVGRGVHGRGHGADPAQHDHQSGPSRPDEIP